MLIQRLRATTSRLLKEDILKSATALDLIMFRYAYDKNYSYGIKCTPPVSLPQELTTADIELLDKLRSRELSGNAARDAVYAHPNPLVRLICNKDLDCGATATLVNKVHPGTVPVFKVQLAKEQH